MVIFDLLKMVSMLDVDAFIEQARKIADKFKSNPNLAIEAKQEARVLLKQFEEYLEARGLKASAQPKT
jgi:hypothetical protein